MRLPSILSLFLAMIPLLAAGGESYFFIRLRDAKEVVKRVEGDELHIVIPIKKVAPPKASSIYACRQDLGPGRKYQIQIDLAAELPEEWGVPLVKLGDEVIDRNIIYSPGDPITLHLESDDPEKIKRWCKLLGELLKIPDDEIEMDFRDSEVRKREAEERWKEKEKREGAPAR
jgi:hypothetical protein